MRIGILANEKSWYYRDLQRVAACLGHDVFRLDFPLLLAKVEPTGTKLCNAEHKGNNFDAVIVRTMPPGSLEQVVYRMDALAAWESAGVVVVNSPKAIECAVDKFLTTHRLAQNGLNIPRTLVCEDAESAMDSFTELGEDVVIKPLFGAEGRGIVRVSDPDLAWRTFRTLERLDCVLYLQEFIPHPGWDVRVMVLNGQVLGGMKRINNNDFRTNIARQSQMESHLPTQDEQRWAITAAESVGAWFAGVDVLYDQQGLGYVIEVNAVPGWQAFARATGQDIAQTLLQQLEIIVTNNKLTEGTLMQLEELTTALSNEMPAVLRWCGAVAKRLRQFNVAVSGKTSGSSNTDALTLADLSVQELLVAALRDLNPLFRQCRLEAEESTGDLEKFALESEYTIALDPIDGTMQFRDHTGNGWAVMLNLRTEDAVQYSLVYIPETGEHGTWVEAVGNRIAVGEDDPNRPAAEVVNSIPAIDPQSRKESKKIYMIGFLEENAEKAKLVTEAGLEGQLAKDMPGSIFELFARGEYAGSLIHSPNVYDFPVTSHIARILGGDALWVHNKESLHFRKLWTDEKADMLRLPGIIACSHDHEILNTLCEVAKDWNPNRYRD